MGRKTDDAREEATAFIMQDDEQDIADMLEALYYRSTRAGRQAVKTQRRRKKLFRA